jgi:hypothetical protein
MKNISLILATISMVCSTELCGQELTGTVTNPAARSISITCLSNDAMHPVPGTPYTYSISIPSIPGEKTYKWIVTQEQTYLTDGVLNLSNAESTGGIHIAAAGDELNTTTNAGVGETIGITWKSFTHDPAKPVFVVIYVENTDGCTTQNVKAFQIEPRQAFTLDIANLKADGTVSVYGEQLESCVSNVASAKYDPAATEGIIYDYGTDYSFFVVNAAGFTGSWQPEFQLSGITDNQTVTTEWAYAGTPAIWNPAVTTVNVKDASGSAGSAGECIIVRVTIKHNSDEVTTALNITLAVDGTSNSMADIHHADCTADGFANDIAIHVLKPRPAVLKL